MQIQVLRITDQDDPHSDPMYFTPKRLRDQVLNEWYSEWVEEESESEITREQIAESDESLFDFMHDWGYNVEIILTITKDDL